MRNNLQLLYNSTLSKYRKFKKRYDKNIQSGQFYEISNRKQHQIVCRLKRLYNRLLQLKWQLKVAIATGVLAISLQGAPTQAQQLGPFVQEDSKNPFFRSVSNYDNNKKITFADIDNDGDTDAAIGVDTGEIIFYENIGNATQARYVIRSGIESPFDGILSPYGQAAPELVDFDGDGDFDMVLGDFNGYFNSGVYYFENSDFEDDGIIGNGPNFTEITSPGSPIDGISASKYNVKQTFVDIDGDGDLDAFIGQNGGFPSYQSLIYFENNGSFSSQPLPSGLGEFGFDTGSSNTAPTFHDYDGDGDQDLFIGDVNGNIRYFRNDDFEFDGSIGTNIAFIEETGANNPFDLVDVGTDAVITFADLDADGDFDAFIGASSCCTVYYFQNDGSGGFDEVNGFKNPFDRFDLEYDTSPTPFDYDNDGDYDIVIGTKYNNAGIFLYENNGDGTVTEVDTTNNPFYRITNPNYEALIPELADIDADGDMDFFLGNIDNAALDGVIDFFSNDGSNNFTAETATLGPAANYNRIAQTFGDFDGDGDLDMVVGSDTSAFYPNASFKYFENQGSATSPNFVGQPTDGPPFNGANISPGYSFVHATPNFVDLDHDGDLDIVTGVHHYNVLAKDGRLLFFRNDAGILTEQMSTGDPFAGFVGNDSDPTFIDWDNDGDLDVFVGNSNGSIDYLENQNQPPQTNGNPTSIAFIEGDGPVTIEPFIAISDDTNDDIISATISIVTNYVQGEDVIDVTLQGGVTGSFDAPTGVYTIQGSATMAEYEAMLQSATFFNTNIENPTPNARTIEFAVTDFDNTDPFSDGFPEFQISVQVTPVNDAPTVTTASTAIDFTENSNPVAIDNALIVDDVDNSTLQSALVSLGSSYVQGDDLLAFNSQNGISGSFNSSTGELALTGAASVADYQTALRSVTYQNISDNPGNSPRTVEFSVFDGALNSTVMSRSINLIPVNDPPQIMSNNQGSTLDYNTGTAAIVVDDILDISDLDDTQLASATITISGTETGDNLLFTPAGSISGGFSGGVLSLSGVESISNYITVLRSVQFETTAGSGTRTIEFVVNDGSDDSPVYTKDINVIGANLPPIVNTTPGTTQEGSVITIDLCAIISDPDNNFDELSISVLSTTSGATTNIDGCDLTIDYANTNFSGNDDIVIEACDPSGSCDENTLSIQVEAISEVNIFNAVSPNNDGLNDIWEIQGLTQPNNIVLFNRWGDEVKSIANAASPIANINLDDLPAATYFYRINSPEGTFEGYVVIKK